MFNKEKVKQHKNSMMQNHKNQPQSLLLPYNVTILFPGNLALISWVHISYACNQQLIKSGLTTFNATLVAIADLWPPEKFIIIYLLTYKIIFLKFFFSLWVGRGYTKTLRLFSIDKTDKYHFMLQFAWIARDEYFNS